MSVSPSLDLVRAGDPGAVALLVQAHQGALRRFVATLFLPPGEVDDVAQEVFLRALERMDQIQDLEGFPRFLRGIARNVVHECHRRQRRRCDDLAPHLEHLAAQVPPAEPDETSRLRACLERLAPRARQLLERRYVDGLGAEEAGRDCAMSANAVRLAVLRAREQLLRCVQNPVGAG